MERLMNEPVKTEDIIIDLDVPIKQEILDNEDLNDETTIIGTTVNVYLEDPSTGVKTETLILDSEDIKQEAVDNEPIDALCLSDDLTADELNKLEGPGYLNVRDGKSNNLNFEEAKKKLFFCQQCERHFQMESVMHYHFPCHFQDTSHQCITCGKKFTTRSDLRKHELNFQCAECYICFSDNEVLNSHLASHAGEKKYSCLECGELFSLNILSSHMLVHKGMKQFQCPICLKFFNRKMNLKKHMLIHAGEKPYKCRQCEKSFTRKQTLAAHELTHTKEKNFQCEICGRQFRRKSCLNTHHLVHRGEKPHQCHECNKCFALKTNLRQHMLIHTGQKPFRCLMCNITFIKLKSLQSHVYTIHLKENIYNCPYCKKTFSKKSVLREHLHSHTADKKVQCNACQRLFQTNASLNSHLPYCFEKINECPKSDENDTSSPVKVPREETSQTIEKPLKLNISNLKLYNTKSKGFVCDVCNISFAEKSSLETHTFITHKDTHEFECTACSKFFAKKSCLDSHMLTHMGVKKIRCPNCNEESYPYGNDIRHRCTRLIGNKVTQKKGKTKTKKRGSKKKTM